MLLTPVRIPRCPIQLISGDFIREITVLSSLQDVPVKRERRRHFRLVSSEERTRPSSSQSISSYDLKWRTHVRRNSDTPLRASPRITDQLSSEGCGEKHSLISAEARWSWAIKPCFSDEFAAFNSRIPDEFVSIKEDVSTGFVLLVNTRRHYQIKADPAWRP